MRGRDLDDSGPPPAVVWLTSQGERRFHGDDLPLRVGGAPGDALPLPETSETVAVVGWFGSRFFVQAHPSAVSVMVNGEPLAGLHSLGSGDRVEIAGTRIDCQIAGGELRLSTNAASAASGPDRSTGFSEDPITPIPYQPAGAGSQRRQLIRMSPRAMTVVGTGAVLVILLWFSLTAVSVRVVTDPPADDVDLPGTLMKLELGERLLLRPGIHRVVAQREGYDPIDTSIRVGGEADQEFTFTMAKRPGRVHLITAPAEGAVVSVDGVEVGTTPLPPLELSAGKHRLSISAQRYLEYDRELEVEGAGMDQSLEVELTPAWSIVHVTSSPTGASIRVEGSEVGRTPLALELDVGEHGLEAQLAGHKTWRGDVNVEADRELTLPVIALKAVDGHLLLRSRPPAAHVSVGGTLAGQTPVQLRLEPGEAHEITLFKPGYELVSRRIQVGPGERAERTVELAPRHGTVEFSLFPSDAKVHVDGRETKDRRLRLLTIPHEIRFSKAGYVARTVIVTPRPDFPQRISVKLLTKAEHRKATAAPEIVSKRGQKLVFVEPGSFVMGAARGTPGRRPNEASRAVELARPFYLGVKEITNREFREFRPEHRSPPFHGEELNAEDQPVSSVSWDDAARFCNWLSGQEGLPPAYVDRGGRMAPVRPTPASYRLPTEAEWAWVARFAAGGGGLLYPWGNKLPPPMGSGNYADVSGSSVLDRAMSSYNDGFSVAAPVGSSKANGLRLFDLGGNVAEWIHDYYGIAPQPSSSAAEKDPTGPTGGAHHVLRGSSWKHWNVTQLRFSYRDYGNEGREDVGFRIARYVD